MKLTRRESKERPKSRTPAKVLAAALLTSTALAGCSMEPMPAKCDNPGRMERPDSYACTIEPAVQLECGTVLNETFLYQDTVELQVNDKKIGLRLVGLRPEPTYSSEEVVLAVRVNDICRERDRVTLGTGDSAVVANGDAEVSVKFVEMEHATVTIDSQEYEGVCRTSWARFEITKVCPENQLGGNSLTSQNNNGTPTTN